MLLNIIAFLGIFSTARFHTHSLLFPLIYDNNDEIVLELFINREISKGMVDISDSRGYSFFKDKEINICHEILVIWKN